MSSFWVWGVALVLYGLFLAWYVNWRGPLSATETTEVLKKVSANLGDGGDRNDLGVLKAFLEADDGREFYMLNVIRFAEGPVADPVSGEMRPAREVMNGYTRMFLPSLFLLAGHPAFAARKIGGFVDTWGMEPGPDWSMIGYMRYRSRRDLARMVVNPRFSGAHDFKYAAMPQTFNFPTRPMIMTLANPRIWVGLSLALAAALAQIALLLAQAL
jgi:hypothetical protein